MSQPARKRTPRIVHVQTTIQTVFGVLDGDNVVPQQPITAEVRDFQPRAFTDAYKAIKRTRDDAAKPAPEPSKANGGNRRRAKPRSK